MSLYIPKMSDTPAITIQGLADNFGLLDGSQIVEQGSNQNGEYVRWENGLQVCWTEVRETVNITLSAQFGGYYGDGTARSFPAAFAGSPAVLVTLFNGPFAAVDRISSSGYTVRYRSISSMSNLSTRAYVFAIGRWK